MTFTPVTQTAELRNFAGFSMKPDWGEGILLRIPKARIPEDTCEFA